MYPNHRRRSRFHVANHNHNRHLQIDSTYTLTAALVVRLVIAKHVFLVETMASLYTASVNLGLL